MGLAGTLCRVDRAIFGDADVIVDIRGTVLGIPAASDELSDQLGRVDVTSPSLPLGLVSVDLRPFKIAVTPGDVLVIVLHGSGVHNWSIALSAMALIRAERL